LFFFHSYKCQGIQINNPFDKILGLSFNFEPFNNPLQVCQKESILQRIIKMTHIIKQNWWERNKEDKDLFNTLKKHSYPKMCKNLKL
jgi:hypothetical protein